MTGSATGRRMNLASAAPGRKSSSAIRWKQKTWDATGGEVTNSSSTVIVSLNKTYHIAARAVCGGLNLSKFAEWAYCRVARKNSKRSLRMPKSMGWDAFVIVTCVTGAHEFGFAS